VALTSLLAKRHLVDLAGVQAPVLEAAKELMDGPADTMPARVYGVRVPAVAESAYEEARVRVLIELAGRGRLAPGALSGIPELALLELADRLVATGQAAAGVQAVVAAAFVREGSGDKVAAAQHFIRALGMPDAGPRHDEAMAGLVRMAPSLGQRCIELQERCRELECALLRQARGRGAGEAPP